MISPQLFKGISFFPQSIRFSVLRNMSNASRYAYETLKVSSPQDHVLHVELNRPENLNAMNQTFWREIPECFREIRDDTDCRSVVLSGAGKIFTAGLDFGGMQDIFSHVMGPGDIARKAKYLQSVISSMQDSFTAIEKCPKPVIAAVHGGCIGGGVDLITACDIRYCTQDAYFTVKEVDLGLAADVGTLQRLPKIIQNDSKVRELVYTADNLNAADAKELGLVSRVFTNKEEMIQGALALAGKIASKSPVAVQGSKVALNYSRDHSVQEGLAFMTYWNMTMLQSEDVLKSAEALITKSDKPPTFSKL